MSNLQNVVEITRVKSVDGQYHYVRGKGDINIPTPSSAIKKVNNVLYVPGLTKNLLSVGSIPNRGYSILFYSNKCFVVKTSKLDEVVAQSQRDCSNCLYRLEVYVVDLEPIEEFKLWHTRYGQLLDFVCYESTACGYMTSHFTKTAESSMFRMYDW